MKRTQSTHCPRCQGGAYRGSSRQVPPSPWAACGAKPLPRLIPARSSRAADMPSKIGRTHCLVVEPRPSAHWQNKSRDVHKIRQPLCFMCSKNCTPADNLPLCRSHNAKEQMERDHCPQMWTKQLKQRRRTESVSKAVLNQQLYIHMYLKVEKSMQLQNCSCAGAKYCTQKKLVLSNNRIPKAGHWHPSSIHYWIRGR